MSLIEDSGVACLEGNNLLELRVRPELGSFPRLLPFRVSICADKGIVKQGQARDNFKEEPILAIRMMLLQSNTKHGGTRPGLTGDHDANSCSDTYAFCDILSYLDKDSQRFTEVSLEANEVCVEPLLINVFGLTSRRDGLNTVLRT